MGVKPLPPTPAKDVVFSRISTFPSTSHEADEPTFGSYGPAWLAFELTVSSITSPGFKVGPRAPFIQVWVTEPLPSYGGLPWTLTLKVLSLMEPDTFHPWFSKGPGAVPVTFWTRP